ncbi:NFACT RNA binding domain-containing protein [Melioribacter sp. Ez-97]|uniref:NFACT RNA binding domain-containing protein n=1 Tax=Melioribacter sp. Ez-97 TaxID=3423434 RepID=UPI003ED8E46D
MFKNYLYLLRAVIELNESISGNSILEIYTQEKDKLFISIPKYDFEKRHLIISANSQMPYLIVKDSHSKAKKNYKNFFEEFLPSGINKIEIAQNDRIIKFSCDNFNFYFLIRGANTNIILQDPENNFFPFKKTDDNKLKATADEIIKCEFVSSYDHILNDLQSMNTKELKSNYKFIDRKIKTEFLEKGVELKSLITDILFNDIIVAKDKAGASLIFQPYPDEDAELIGKYDSYQEAINAYLSNYYSLSKEKVLTATLKKYIANELERLSGKLNNLKSRIENGSREKEYSNYGNLLLINISALKKGLDKIDLKDMEGNSVTIKLDPKLSPQKNIDRYFEKAKSEKIEYEKSIELYDELKNKFESLKELNEKFDKELTLEELKNIEKQLGIKKKMEIQDKSRPNFRHFIIDGKYHVYVGKDSRNNDELTLRFAKQNDYWFHARSVSGSHLVLRTDNPKEAVPKPVLKKAASIAAFYSKAKTAGLAPVSYTFKKYVVKKKGMVPGKVALLKEEVLLVKPEIPPGCEVVD